MAYTFKCPRVIGVYFNNITLILTFASGLNCYNIEENKVGIFREQRGSQFGYSVAIVRAPGWTNTQQEKEFYPKQLLVGAPNLTYNMVRAHGQVSGCGQPDMRDLQCHWLNLTDISKFCDSLKRNDTADCTLDSRLGATIAVNRQYPQVRASDAKIPMVTVCSPGWKNVFPESLKSKLQNYIVGMCLKLRDDLQPINCTISENRDYRKYCIPFWAGNDGTTTSAKGRPVYTHAQGGMSATFTKDGLSEIIGGPGADDWRGAYISYQKHWTVRRDNMQGDTLLFAYSLDTGKLQNGEFIISGMPNYYVPGTNGHFGKFEIYIGTEKITHVEFGVPYLRSCQDPQRVNLNELILDKQTGTKFGASVATVDLTGDGDDELVVGAPLYSETRSEEGRVFVYMFDGKDVCGPIGVLSGGAKTDSLASKTAFARFGSAIASAGDLDLDGNKDLAVGAPYEDDGHGAVYIYRGIGPCMCQMKDVFAQRIAGVRIDPGIRSFGWSIYGDEDVDDNSFPDLAVGAYESDMAVVLRSRPIVNVDVKMEITPSPIPLNGSQLQCSRDKKELCFNVTVTFQFTSVGRRKGDVASLAVTWKLDSDTVYMKETIASRVEFSGTDGLGSITENITLSSGNSTVKTYTLFVKKHNGKPEPQDAWTKIQMEGIYQLVPLSGQDFQQLDPVLNTNAQTVVSESVEFDKKCDNLDECTSDLSLNVEMFLLKRDGLATKVDNNTIIYVDAFNELEITAEVKTLANSSYKANFTAEVSAEMKRELSSNNGRINATCKYDLKMTLPTHINCVANSKLDEKENIKVKGLFDISAHRLVPGMDVGKMRQNLRIRMHAGQANTDSTPNNNDFERTIKIKLKYDIYIEADKKQSDQVRYTADEKSGRAIRLVHSYDIINEGPSFLPMTYVNISIPVRTVNHLLAVIKEYSSSCNIRSSEPLVQTTPPDTGKSTEHFNIQSPDSERRRRQVEAYSQTAAATNITAGPTYNTINITCQGYECVILECHIGKLGRQQQHTVHVAIDIYEKEITKIAKTNQGTRQMRYLTTATLTDPIIWFGDKVVPLQKTVYAEKWTTLIVEPTSLVPKVNIGVIIGSVVGAVVLLIIIIVILWKCGFFARKKHNHIQEWKKSSLYNTKSVRLSSTQSTSRQPYTSIGDENKKPTEGERLD